MSIVKKSKVFLCRYPLTSAIDRAKIYIKKYKWFLKLDFLKCFDSIDHGIVKEQLGRLRKEDY